MGEYLQRYRVVSCFTDDDLYRGYAAMLKSSLEKFGVVFEIDAVPDRGGWEKNAAYKAEFIQSKWSSSDIPLVWLDADATVESPPLLFSRVDCDFAAHKWEG